MVWANSQENNESIIIPDPNNLTHGYVDLSNSLRILQDDVVDDYDFEDGEEVEDYNPKMAPANTKVDDDKSKNIRKYIVSTESDIVKTTWCGESTSLVIGQTAKGQIYRSADGGQTWEAKHDFASLEGSAGQLDKANVRRAAKISEVVLSPVDPNLLFFVGAAGVNWVSEDCGQNYKPLNNGRGISQFKFHPTERNWAMASIFTSWDDFSEDDEPCKIYREVYYTKNLGETWTFLKDYVIEFEWGKFAVHDGIEAPLIFLLIQKNTNGHLDVSTWNAGNTLISTNDFMKSSRTVVKGANRFAMVTEYIYVARIKTTGEVSIVMSERSKKFASFHVVKLPSSVSLSIFEYNLMESWSGAVFLFIKHNTQGSESYGNVYMSDATGKGFSLTLSRVPLGSNGYADIEEVNSIEGVIIANRYAATPKANQKPEDLLNEGGKLKKLKNQAAESAKLSNLRKRGKSGGDTIDDTNPVNRRTMTNEQSKKSQEIPIKTYISMNRGGNWILLQAPDKTAKGKSIKCNVSKGCSLHLHSYSSPMYPVPYSHNNAVGLIMGVGNLGTKLKYDMEETNTYLSRDGGLTWLEIMNGPHILEFGDHGAIIVMAPIFKPTNSILYSWNEGISWTEYKISKAPLNIDAIEVEPQSRAQKFIISARRAKSSNNKGYLLTLDFSDLHEPQCSGISSPDTESSDYETWSPYDGRQGDKCFLGKKITYVRRKRDRECFNGEEREKILFQENCPWSEMDFEWDIGYKRTESGQCETSKKVVNEPPEDWDTYYFISKGYRRIPGDTWEGGGEYDPIRISCPGQWSYFTFKTLVVLAILGAAYYVITESEWIVGVVDWINEKVASLKGEENNAFSYSKEFNKGPESVGDSDEDDKIVTGINDEKNLNQRRKNEGDDLEGGKDEAQADNLIDINKYEDSDDENASIKHK